MMQNMSWSKTLSNILKVGILALLIFSSKPLDAARPVHAMMSKLGTIKTSVSKDRPPVPPYSAPNSCTYMPGHSNEGCNKWRKRSFRYGLVGSFARHVYSHVVRKGQIISTCQVSVLCYSFDIRFYFVEFSIFASMTFRAEPPRYPLRYQALLCRWSVLSVTFKPRNSGCMARLSLYFCGIIILLIKCCFDKFLFLYFLSKSFIWSLIFLWELILFSDT